MTFHYPQSLYLLSESPSTYIKLISVSVTTAIYGDTCPRYDSSILASGNSGESVDRYFYMNTGVCKKVSVISSMSHKGSPYEVACENACMGEFSLRFEIILKTSLLLQCHDSFINANKFYLYNYGPVYIESKNQRIL